MSLLNVAAISKKEGENYVLRNINFVQEPFQKIAIAGATGSGKTTLLKIIAGLIQPDSGEVLFEGARVKGPQEKLLPGHPAISYLSQHFELRNHYKVEEVLQMVNRLSQSDAATIYKVCRISHLLDRWTGQVSGGERQRIALAQFLVCSPKLLLLDEPYSNLDAIHKNILRAVINDISDQLQISSILVSHDPVDLLSWADEIIVLNHGSVVQKGSPEELYDEPVNEYVAGLFGKYNLISPALSQILSLHERRFIRPNGLKISKEETGLQGVIRAINFMGAFYEIEVELDGGSRLIVNHVHTSFNPGEMVYITAGLKS